MSKKITSICIFFAKIFAYVKKKQYFCTREVSLAQLVEQLTLNQWVEGSSPSGDTNKKDAKRHLFLFYKLSANRSASSI